MNRRECFCPFHKKIRQTPAIVEGLVFYFRHRHGDEHLRESRSVESIVADDVGAVVDIISACPSAGEFQQTRLRARLSLAVAVEYAIDVVEIGVVLVYVDVLQVAAPYEGCRVYLLDACRKRYLSQLVTVLESIHPDALKALVDFELCLTAVSEGTLADLSEAVGQIERTVVNCMVVGGGQFAALIEGVCADFGYLGREVERFQLRTILKGTIADATEVVAHEGHLLKVFDVGEGIVAYFHDGIECAVVPHIVFERQSFGIPAIDGVHTVAAWHEANLAVVLANHFKQAAQVLVVVGDHAVALPAVAHIGLC